MVKKQKKTDLQIIEILQRKEDTNRQYFYLVKYLNGEKNWVLQKKIRKPEAKILIKNFDKLFPKIERRGRKKKNKNTEKTNEEVKTSTEHESQNLKNMNIKEENSIFDKEINVNSNLTQNEINDNLTNEELNDKYKKMEYEIIALKDENEKLKDELIDNTSTYNNLSEWLSNLSKENEKLKMNLENKTNELNLIKEKYNIKSLKNNNESKGKSQNTLLELSDENENLNSLYSEQKIENYNLKQKINDLVEKNNQLNEYYQNLEKKKAEIINDFIEQNKNSNEIIKEKDSIISDLKDKIFQYEEIEKKISNEKINDENEVWKQKYENLNEQYGIMADNLKSLKNKNKNLTAIFNLYKEKYGDVDENLEINNNND